MGATTIRTLVADGVFPGVSAFLTPLAADLGLELTVADSYEEARAKLPSAQLLLLKNLPFAANDIKAAQELRGVQKLGRLTDSIDVDALKRRRIPFRTMGLPSAVAVADHTLALILALYRQLLPATRAMGRASSIDPITTDERRFAYNWANFPTTSLAGKTIGLIGFGEVANEVAMRARAFGMEVHYTKRVQLPNATERKLKVTFASFDDLLRESDVVSIHVPHTPATIGLIGARELGSMKDGALLINTARGAIVDENALVESLRSGHLGGAGLDVFTIEPLPSTSPLLDAPRTILTPHMAGAGGEALARAIAASLEGWASVLKR